MIGAIETDVLVVGGGPAGSAAAATLSRRGLGVVLVDRARFPRDKCCGDGLTTGALRRLEGLGLAPSSVPSFTFVRSLAVRSPRGRVVELPLERDGSSLAAVARRRHLDAALLSVARDAGAEVLEGCRLVQVELVAADRPCHAVLGDGRSVRSYFVVAADGAWSTVRSLLGRAGRGATPAPRPERGWHAFRAYATGVAARASERLWVAFEPGLLPGYLWSFPVGDRCANVGIVLRRGPGSPGQALAGAWRAATLDPFLTSLLGPGASLESPARSWPIPSGIDRVEVSDPTGRVLYVGDAARAADPFTGEGIAQALQTGALAAEAIATRCRSDPGSAAGDYEAEVRASLALEHRLDRALSALASRAAGAEAIVAVAGLGATSRALAGRWLFEDLPRVPHGRGPSRQERLTPFRRT